MAESKYIEFYELADSGKTKIWDILSKRHGDILGKIKWYGAWRQYCFFPSPAVVFNKTCMEDIIDFIQEEMAYRSIKKSRIGGSDGNKSKCKS